MKCTSSIARALAALLLWAAGAACAQDAGCPPAAPSPADFKMEELVRQSRDRGLLWQIEKDGRTSWLYGTVHVSRVEWMVPGERVRAALAGSDVVALELDPTDPELARVMLASADPARSARVLAGLQPRLAKLAARACIPEKLLAPLPPLLQLTTLSMFEARREGVHPELAVDAVLWGMALGQGKTLVALETPASQLAALTPESEADERALLASGLQELEGGDNRELTGRLLRAWSEGDEAALASYPQWCHCLDTPAEQRFFRRLNDERNIAIADKLVAMHGQGGRLFAAVGALHMTGPNALTTLLRARGFQVRRIVFNAQGAAS